MPEHELLGDLLEAQAAKFVAAGAEGIEADKAAKTTTPGSAAAAVAESTLRVDAARIDAVMNLVGELIIGKSMLNRTLTEFDKQHSHDPVRAKLADAMAFQARILDELHKCVLKIRMVPVEQLFRRFPRIVRDVAKQCGKDVALEISGQNTDLDKGILDSLAEPLMHLVRNAVDHGVGSAEERLAAGNPGRGTTFQLRVPLTLASIQTLLFRVGGRLFAVPLSSVVEITRITGHEIHKVDQREVLRLREQILTLVRLNHLSRLRSIDSQPEKKKNFVIVIGAAEKRFGLVVDSLVGEEELVIKALPGEIVSSDLVSGASILGDGTVVLILNVPSIVSRLSRVTPLGAIA